ncbi:MAG: DUF1127 domain-containing protein [Rhizobiaceae bacterium]
MIYLLSFQPARAMGAIGQVILNFFKDREMRIAQRHSLRALNNLDNHALKDLAICKSEIYSVCYASSIDRR